MQLILMAYALAQPAPAPGKVLSPADAVRLASQDALKLGADVAVRTRYLWLTGDAKAKQELFQVLSVWCNVLSREPDLVPFGIVMEDGRTKDDKGQPISGLLLPKEQWDNVVLLRLILDDYGWPRAVWETLQEDDPYFHVRLEAAKTESVTQLIDWPGGIWRIEDGGDGKFYERGRYNRRKDVAVGSAATYALAPWVGNDKSTLVELTTATGSQSPIFRADWFLWETGVQADRKVGFYGLLGVKNRADFQKLVGFDQKLSEAFTRELLASVANSGVAQQPRRIARFEKIGGAYWSTFDNKLAQDKRNPLRVLNGGFQHDAEEVFSHGANGLWKVGLFAANGDRQDSAPDFVGFDKTSHSNDGRIHVGLSCFRCHQQGKGSDGLNDIKDWSRTLFKPPLALTGPDYDTIKKLRQSYLRRLEPFMDADRKRHAESVRELSGLSPVEWGAALGGRWAAYDGPVDLGRAAGELGVPVETWRRAIDAYMKSAGQTDTVLGMYNRPLNDQVPLPLSTWHESYAQAQTILRSVR